MWRPPRADRGRALNSECAHLRIGTEAPPRPFAEGQVQTFDDNFVHEVHYPAGISSQRRVVLVVDTANPLLAREVPAHRRRGVWGDNLEAYREAWWLFS